MNAGSLHDGNRAKPHQGKDVSGKINHTPSPALRLVCLSSRWCPPNAYWYTVSHTVSHAHVVKCARAPLHLLHHALNLIPHSQRPKVVLVKVSSFGTVVPSPSPNPITRAMRKQKRGTLDSLVAKPPIPVADSRGREGMAAGGTSAAGVCEAVGSGHD